MRGRTVSHYEIVEKLGAGGMGEVYLARDTLLERAVALKVLPADKSDDPEHRRRFLREARSASSLNHPGIITVYDVLSEGGTDYLVMEYVQGVPLHRWIPPGGLPPAKAVAYAVQIAEAVAAAHAAGVVHRDLKPGNVMVTPDERIKVLDFGLAKRHAWLTPGAGATLTALTRVGSIMGTVQYMAPEQALGKPVDARCDVFSLGVMLYEMLTSRRPFRGKTPVAVVQQMTTGEPPPVESLRPDLPAALGAIVRRALAREREDRFPTMARMAAELRAVGAELEPVTVSAAPPPQPAGAPAAAATAAAPAMTLPTRLSSELFGTSVFARRPPAAAALALVVLLAIGLAAVPAGRELVGGWLAAALPRDAAATAPSGEELDGLEPYELYQRGQALLARYDREGSIDRALDLFQRAIGKSPESAAAYAGVAMASWRKYFQDNKDPIWLERALGAGQRAVALDGHLVRARIGLVLPLAELGRFGEAGEELDAALALDAGNLEVQVARARFHLLRGENDLAEEALEEAIALAPDNWDAHLELGELRFHAARYGEAAESFARVARITPDNYLAHRSLAAVFHMQGRIAEAAGELQKALEIRPDWGTYSNLGTLYFFQGRYAEAASAYDRAIELGANNHLAWANLADAHRWTPGREEEAREAYLRAVQLVSSELAVNPENPTHRSRLAVYLAKRGDREAALSELALLDSLAAPDASVLFRSLLAYEIAGERDVALAKLDRALTAGYSLQEIRSEPELTELRQDPRYHRILAAHPAPREAPS